LSTYGDRRHVHEDCTNGPPCHLSRSMLWQLPSPRWPQPEHAPPTQETPPTARFTTVTTEGGTGTSLSPPCPSVGTRLTGRSHDQLHHSALATVAPLLGVYRPAVPAAVALLIARPTHNRLSATRRPAAAAAPPLPDAPPHPPPPPAPTNDAAHSLRIVRAAHPSFRTGKTVEL